MRILRNELRTSEIMNWIFFLKNSLDHISGILPEVSVDPMKVIEDAVLEFTDKKDLFLAYMSSMIVGGPGKENNKVFSKKSSSSVLRQ